MPSAALASARIESLERDDSSAPSLADQLELLQSVYDASPNLLLSVRVDSHQILNCNEKAATTLGYAKHELIGRSALGLCHPASRAILAQTLDPVQPLSIRYLGVKVLSRDGAELDVCMCSSRITSAAGITRSDWLWHVVDDEFQPEAGSYRTLFEGAPVGIARVAMDGRFIEVNPALCNMLGYGAKELLQKTFSEITPAEERPYGLKGLREFLEGTSSAYRAEKRYLAKDGREVWVNLTVQLVSTVDEKYMVSIVEDVTKKRQLTRTIGEQQARFQRVFEAAQFGIVIASADGAFQQVNPAFCRMLGYDTDELSRMTIADVSHPANRNATRRLVAELLAGPEHGSIDLDERYVKKDGSLLSAKVSASAIRAPDGATRQLLAVVQDQSQRRKIEALEASNLRQQVLLRETHHRVKNNLQVVSSILRIQERCARDDFDRRMLQQTQHRVRTLAILHETLCNSGEPERIQLARYLRAIASSVIEGSVEEGVKITLDLDVDDSTLDFPTAVCCGLIANELITNSVKHAFVGKPSGRITVRYRQREGECSLLVGDDGVGLHHGGARVPTSVGSKLMGALADQIDGKLTFDGSNGSVAKLSFITSQSSNSGGPSVER